jgi:hypothetical protein
VTLPTNISRFALAAAASSLVTAAAFATACGSDATAATPDDGGAGEGSTLPTEDAAPDDDRHDPLNGQDAGCPLKVDGPRSGTTAASVPRSGSGIAWATPENARTIDTQFALATLDLGQTSEHLRITDFGFAIPASATIKGVEVEFKRQAGDTGIADGNIELWLDGKPSDRPKFLASSWPRTIVGTHHYGQAVDTWGNDLTPELVGKPGFGVEIYALRKPDAGAGPIEARVESMRITIFYCE